jgi:hypothetical protein
MTYFSVLNASAQIIARLLLIAAGYLAFVLFALVCLVLCGMVSEGSGIARASGAASKLQKSEWLSEIDGQPIGVPSRWSIARNLLPWKIS